MKARTTKFDAASYLDSEDKIAAYLNAILEMDDPALTAEAIGTVARARGMAEIAKEANVTRESLYRSLSLKGNPELKTVAKVLGSLGMQFRVVKATTKSKPAKRAAAETTKKTATKAKKKPARKARPTSPEQRIRA